MEIRISSVQKGGDTNICNFIGMGYQYYELRKKHDWETGEDEEPPYLMEQYVAFLSFFFTFTRPFKIPSFKAKIK